MQDELKLLGGAMATSALVVVPFMQLKPIAPPAGLKPYTAAQLRGRAVYIQNGCVYCHSQQPRDRAMAPDGQRGCLIVAFSGAAARRRRACARLNTFVICDQTKPQEEFFQHIALTKFEKVYLLSNKIQRGEMLRNLTPQALEAVHAGLGVTLTEQETNPAPPLPLT